MLKPEGTEKEVHCAISSLLAVFTVTVSLALLLVSCTESPSLRRVGVSYLMPLGKPPAVSLLWSPIDKTKILVNASYSNFSQSEVYVLDTQTGEKNLLAHTDQGVLIGRSWSPDGNNIIISADPDTQGFESGGLWSLDVANHSKKFIQNGGGLLLWGPDQNWLTSFPSIKTSFENPRIERTNTISGESQIIHEINKEQDIFGFSWAPDGKKLVFSLGDDLPSTNSNIYIKDSVTGKIQQITDSGDNTYPVWSPKNDLIAYRKLSREGTKVTYSLYLINPNGTCETKLIGSQYLSPPTWSLDGNELAFVSDDGIYVIKLDQLLERNVSENLCP